MFRFIVVLLLIVVFVLLFQTRSIKVKGNEYYGENSIISWLEKDKLSMNTVYLFWKYNYTDAEVPSVVEEMKLTFENPWTLVAHVKEKGKSGYVSFNDTNLYFDRKGTALFESKKTFTGVPYVEGLSFDASKVEIGKKIPVEDDSAFTLIAEASKYLVKYSLTPDKLVYANEQSVVLYFGSVEVLIGNKEYEIRIAQIKPILENENIRKIGHHLKYDAHIFANHGIIIQGWYFDTMLASYVLNAAATRHGMDDVARVYLSHLTTTFEQIAGKGVKQKTFNQIELEIAAHYAAEDAHVTYRLYEVLKAKLQSHPELVHILHNIEMPVARDRKSVV